MAFTKGKKLRAVFRKHFAVLMLQVSGPEQLAAQLYSKSLISHATIDKVIILSTSHELKVLHLLKDLDIKIWADPEKLFVFIQVIEGDPSLEELAENMLHLAGRSTSYSLFIIVFTLSRVRKHFFYSVTELALLSRFCRWSDWCKSRST